jgi:hypothetical protein
MANNNSDARQEVWADEQCNDEDGGLNSSPRERFVSEQMVSSKRAPYPKRQ